MEFIEFSSELYYIFITANIAENIVINDTTSFKIKREDKRAMQKFAERYFEASLKTKKIR